MDTVSSKEKKPCAFGRQIRRKVAWNGCGRTGWQICSGLRLSMVYPSADRVRQYLNFQKHIQRICEELGNRMVALLAITLAHNELKDGGYKMIGAETAQMHPNAQVFYGFLRGAGKQYGVP